MPEDLCYLSGKYLEDYLHDVEICQAFARRSREKMAEIILERTGIVFCKVLKKDVERFEEALERLKDKMLLLGHKDYPDACGEIAKMIEEDMKARMRK